MADLNPISFFLNSGVGKDSSAVQAPAFSLTKVMVVVAPLVTGLATWLTNSFSKTSFSTGQITTLIVSLVAFLAISASADVLARGIASSAQLTASGRLRMLTFSEPIPGLLETTGKDKDVTVVAASDSNPPELLCFHDNVVTWEPASKVTLVKK